MRNPISNIAHWIVRIILSLIAIVVILLGYNYLHDEYAKYEHLEREQVSLRETKQTLEDTRDTFAKAILPRIPDRNAPVNLLADSIKSLEAEISIRSTTRQKLWNDHPIERTLPVSPTFIQIAKLDIEIAFLQQGLAYARNLQTFAAGPVEASRQIAWHMDHSAKLAAQIYQSKQAQWELSKRESLTWQIPLTSAYGAMQLLEAEERTLQGSKDQHDTELSRQKAILETLNKRIPPVQFQLDSRAVDGLIQPFVASIAKTEQMLDGSNLRKYLQPAIELLPSALWILGLALLSPLLGKAITYYLIAPVATSRPPVHLLPDSSGEISTAIGSVGSESGQTVPSRVSLPIVVDGRDELLILPSYLQGMPRNAQADTKWLLDWSMPLSSLLSGMYGMTRIRPASEERVTVSSATDPLAEFSLLHVPAGSALVLQPRCLVGLLQTRGEPVKITRHWRLGTLSAWLTLQFRYIVFHGPAKLIVKGCRGVRVESAVSGRTVNQAATLGFSANLAYSVARNETFISYLFGERDLFNDSWSGEGCCVHTETSSAGDRSGLFGRGLQGIVDTFLQIFGI